VKVQILYGGSRVYKYAQQGLIQDLTSFWQTNPHSKNFTKTTIDTTRYQGKSFAIPVSASLYALYYRKSVFERLNIQVPKTWQQLLDTCYILQKQQLSLFALGTKGTEWILHSWFDYINLRLHGLTFYKQLMAGNISFLDDRVRATLEHLKVLKESKCFSPNHHDSSTWDIFPSVLRGYNAMILATNLPEKVHFKDLNDIGIAEFPDITAGIPKYTVTPVDVFVVPSYTKATKELNLLLTYLTTEKFQLGYVEKQQHLPAIIKINPTSNILTKISSNIINNTPGGIQFFDRDVNIAFSRYTPRIFLKFLNNLDVDKTMNELESLRLKVFKN
jgi:multiple sugar transport system substrate-binding protein